MTNLMLNYYQNETEQQEDLKESPSFDTVSC